MPTLGAIKFVPLLRLSCVALDPASSSLGNTVKVNHATRNNMQHVNTAATVDHQHCADAVVDASQVIEHCFPGTAAALPEHIKVAMRVIRLHSSMGNYSHRNAFEHEMRWHSWRGTREYARRHEGIVELGVRLNWGLVVMSEYAVVEQLLNRVGAP
jgi:hypothetical protein